MFRSAGSGMPTQGRILDLHVLDPVTQHKLLASRKFLKLGDHPEEQIIKLCDGIDFFLHLPKNFDLCG